METLADNRDLVEQVKAEARESETMPTATKVIELAQDSQGARKTPRLYNPYQQNEQSRHRRVKWLVAALVCFRLLVMARAARPSQFHRLGRLRRVVFLP